MTLHIVVLSILGLELAAFGQAPGSHTQTTDPLFPREFHTRTSHDILHFGAKGDGISDDTAAFQAALNSVPNGGSVFVPQAPGTYHRYNVCAVKIPNHVTIEGESLAHFDLPGQHVSEVYCPKGPVFIQQSPIAYGIRVTNMLLRGSPSNPASIGINFANCNGCYIEYNSIVGFGGQGILITGGIDGYIAHNMITGLGVFSGLAAHKGVVEIHATDYKIDHNEASGPFCPPQHRSASCLAPTNIQTGNVICFLGTKGNNFYTDNIAEYCEVGILTEVTAGLDKLTNNRAEYNMAQGFIIKGGLSQLTGNMSFVNSQSWPDVKAPYDGFEIEGAHCTLDGNRVDTAVPYLALKHRNGFSDHSSDNSALSDANSWGGTNMVEQNAITGAKFEIGGSTQKITPVMRQLDEGVSNDETMNIHPDHLTLAGPNVALTLQANSADANNRIWDIIANGGPGYSHLSLRVLNDMQSSSETWMQISRAGVNVPLVSLPATSVAAQAYRVKEGGPGAAMGSARLVRGRATVNTSRVTAVSRIFLTLQDCAPNLGTVVVFSRVAGESFTIASSYAANTCNVAWELREPF